MAALHAQRMALAFWFAGTALWFTMYAGVAPTIITYWKGSELIRRLFAHMPAASLEAQYMSYVVDLTAPLLAAFALVQAAGWVREGEDGRTEVELSCPVSRRRLWLERMMALLVGAMVVVAGAVLGLLAGAGLGGLALDTSGVVRAAADLLLLALATGAVGALIVATLRSSTAIGVLGAFIGLSFFITVFGPMLYWPDWITRLSIFQAFGSPYLGAVAARDALFVTAVAVLGAGLTVMIATRRSAAP